MSQERSQFVITVMSQDRVGIVAQVSSAISGMEGDIADLRQSVLRGYFTMILIASFPEAMTAEHVRERLADLNTGETPELEITAKPVEDVPAEDAVPLDNAYVLTASGEDRIGFVAAVSSFCAQHEINILDLSTAVDDELYIMILLVDLSRCGDVGAIRCQLDRFAQETGLNTVLQHHDIFRATNEV